MDGLSSAECTAAPVPNQASDGETLPSLPLRIELKGYCERYGYDRAELTFTVRGPDLLGLYLDLHRAFGPNAAKLAKKERKRRDGERKSQFAEVRAENEALGKHVVEELARRRKAGELRVDIMRSIAAERGISIQHAENAACVYRVELRKVVKVGRSQRDVTIWGMFQAGKSDAEIAQAVGLKHPGSVSRILTRLRREAGQ